MPSPFTPSFGVSPPLLAGRAEELRAFDEALEDGPGSPGRAIIFTGARGSGKTVMLNAVEDRARDRGWLSVSATVGPGMVNDLVRTELPRLLAAHAPDAESSRVTEVSAAAFSVGGGVTREHVERYPFVPSLRSQIEAVTAILPPGRGLLITLDEVHGSAIGELRTITQAVQHAFREGRDLAFVAAGLPSVVEGLLNDEVITFLRRAERFSLGEVEFDEVARALREPIINAGREIDFDAVSIAADGTQGYPFLIQLVGHQIWSVAPEMPAITVEHARHGVDRAARRVGELVHEPALAALSDVDRSFLAAMASDDGASRMADVADRLGVSPTYASQYRLRLIAAGVIRTAGRGRVDIALPYLREYLRDHID